MIYLVGEFVVYGIAIIIGLWVVGGVLAAAGTLLVAALQLCTLPFEGIAWLFLHKRWAREKAERQAIVDKIYRDYEALPSATRARIEEGLMP